MLLLIMHLEMSLHGQIYMDRLKAVDLLLSLIQLVIPDIAVPQSEAL
jgi:hypothetical protein